MSKGAAELVTAAYRRSFGMNVASARAGNVIGSGDWATDRIIPDILRALESQVPVPLRNPSALRPWQHVLEPLSGYLLLGARLAGVGAPHPEAFREAWNFGPDHEAAAPVRELVETFLAAWGEGSWSDQSSAGAPHEASTLRLNIEKAKQRLGWVPRWSFHEMVKRTAEGYRAQLRGGSADELRALCLEQIAAYVKA